MGKNKSASGLTNFVQYDNQGNIFFVSGSNTLMSISSSGAITTTGVISGSNAATASSVANLNQNVQVTGSLGVTSTITAQTLVVQTVTSSIVFSSGSNIFGNTLSNTQQMTGSVLVTGSFSVATTGTELLVTASGVRIGNALTDNHVISGSLTVNPNGLFVSSSGNVGIGTSTPQSIFHIGAPAPSNSGVKTYTGLANSYEGFLFDYYYNTAASNLRVFDIVALGASAAGIGGSDIRFLTVPQTTTGTPLERMRITNSGNVGIGITNPASRLHISGSGIQIEQNGSDSVGLGAYLALQNAGNTRQWVNQLSNANDLFWTNWGGSSYSERMRITTSGSVLIGDSTNVSYNPTFFVKNKNGAVANIAGWNFGGTTTSNDSNNNLLTVGAYYNGTSMVATNTTSTGYQQYSGIHVFYTDSGLTPGSTYSNTERMRIANNGNVGIGTNSPNANLTIYGTSYPFMNIRNANSGVYGMTFGFATVNGDVDIWNYENSYVRIGTNNAERLRVLNDGRVSIGTSSPTNTTLFINGQLNNGNSFRAGNVFAGAQSGGTDYPAIGYNMRFTAGSTIQYEANDFVSYIYFGVGRVDTYTAGAGSAGTTVSTTRGPFVANGGTTWTNGSSDVRVKKNFETTQGLAEVLQIEPVKYHFNWEDDSATKRLGFKAQNLQPLIPEMVHSNGDKFEDGSDILTFTPDYLLPVLVKAIQELKTELDAAKAEIEILKTK